MASTKDITAILHKRTQQSFGYQWMVFGEMTDQFREDFLNYISPVSPDFFVGKRGLDAGCGFGRHLYYAAQFGAKMIGLDFSEAITRAKEIAGELEGVQFIQGEIQRPPIRPRSLDFVYSIGVLHHTPDPEGFFQALLPLVRPGGSVFIWVYSKSRTLTNTLLEVVRKISARLPMGGLRALSLVSALIDWCGFILPYRLARRLGGSGIDRCVGPRIKLYARYPFQVVYADWFDRLAAPIRFYYDGEDLAGWATRAGLVNVKISSTGLYGWRLYGEIPLEYTAGAQYSGKCE
jgi:SAM-dependent methyltransferase